MLRVGKIVATHGLQGAVIIKHIVENTDWLNEGDAIFVEMTKGSNIPYFVEHANKHAAVELLVKLEDVSDAEAAKRLVGKQVFADVDILEKAKADTPLMYIGFELIDQQKGSLGVITDIFQAGAQWIAQIMVEGKEVLIPLADNLILDLNKKNKFIRMDLPNGLIEVYLDS